VILWAQRFREDALRGEPDAQAPRLPGASS